jgi:AcrR family transcriptional regulator
MLTAHGRTRKRRDELLVIAADQFAIFGFHNVTVDDIGRAAGVTGPALYHHFDGKEALLGEMLIAISQHLLDGGTRLANDRSANLLDDLILFHCRFAVDNRSLITVHFRDLIHARAADQRRVRHLQASYATIWSSTVVAANPGIDKRVARAAVHATFGLINSTPFNTALPRASMIELLSTMSTNALSRLT